MFDELSGTINLCGDNVWMGALQQNLNLKKQLEDTLLKAKKSMTRDQKLTLTTEVPRLFAIPNTKEWKPIEKIRKTLTRLLLFLEVGHNKKGSMEKDQPRRVGTIEFPGKPLKVLSSSTKTCVLF